MSNELKIGRIRGIDVRVHWSWSVVFFLAKMRLVTARFLAKNFKYALLLIFIVAAVITPTGDPMTQMIFATPMVALYGLSIIVAWLVGPKRIKNDA